MKINHYSGFMNSITVDVFLLYVLSLCLFLFTLAFLSAFPFPFPLEPVAVALLVMVTSVQLIFRNYNRVAIATVNFEEFFGWKVKTFMDIFQELQRNRLQKHHFTR